MSATCQAWAHRYVGKGPDRKLYEGNCVLDRGHDLDHLPASLAMEQQQTQAFNAGVDAAIAALRTVLADLKDGDVLKHEELALVVTKAKR